MRGRTQTVALGLLGSDALHARHVRHLLDRRGVRLAGPGHRPGPDELRRAGDCRTRGRLFVVETSSRETYTPTRRFYEALGYWEAGRIPDFYGPGDDRVIFLKAAKDATTVNK